MTAVQITTHATKRLWQQIIFVIFIVFGFVSLLFLPSAKPFGVLMGDTGVAHADAPPSSSAPIDTSCAQYGNEGCIGCDCGSADAGCE